MHVLVIVVFGEAVDFMSIILPFFNVFFSLDFQIRITEAAERDIVWTHKREGGEREERERQRTREWLRKRTDSERTRERRKKSNLLKLNTYFIGWHFRCNPLVFKEVREMLSREKERFREIEKAVNLDRKHTERLSINDELTTNMCICRICSKWIMLHCLCVLM